MGLLDLLATRWRRAALLLLICVVPTALLWSFRHAAFVSDDRWFATGTLVAEGRTWLTSRWPHPFGPAHAWRPLVIFSYLLTRAWSDGTPLVYHLTNFALHGINAALLAAIIWRVGGSLIAGCIGGLLFAIHPMTHENVVWISGRTYPLAALFGLALLWWTASGRGRSLIVQQVVGLSLFAAALMSYEAVVTLPVLIGVVWYAAASDDRLDTWQRLRSALIISLPYLVVLVLYFALRWLVVSSFAADSDVWRHGTMANPFLKSARMRLFENVLAFATRLFNGDGVLIDRVTLASAALAGLAAWGAVRSREMRWRACGAIVLAGVAFAPGALAPNYIDRLAYLSLACVMAAVAFGLSAIELRATRAGRVAIAALVVVTAVSWAAQSRVRAAEWQHAGEIAESLLDQLVALEPTPSAGASLHFVDVPKQFRAAYVYITYFHHSVRQRYGREDLDVVQDDGMTVEEVERQLRAQPAASREVVLFRWDAQTERLQRYDDLR